jgi:beta-lactamase superfamily II metal-dependent hydrolase
MREIYVADVGDGLCMAVCTLFGETIHIDCGSHQGSETAFDGFMKVYNHFYKPDVFILSHFHIDHYNGLLLASKKNFRKRYYPYLLKVRKVYYPRIPEFRDKEKFVMYLLTMNLKVFGSETGIMEYDFLRAISRIKVGSFSYKPVSKGDIIDINGSTFEVLWPPKTIESRKTLSVIERALGDFEKALEQDEDLKRLYERVKKEGVFEKYREGGEKEVSEEREDTDEYRDRNYRERELPEIVEKANNSLRKAANHLSLSLFEDNRLLFLGDTEGFEIKEIVDYLKSINRRKFYVFITPHHGTHWHDSLKEIETIYAITSNGDKLCSKMIPDFKEISKMSFATWVNGNISVPIFSIRRFPTWWFYDDEF